MKLTGLRNASLATALMCAVAAGAGAQTGGSGSDASGPGGAGAGLGSLGFGVPKSTAGRGGRGSAGFSAEALGSVAGTFSGAGATGTAVTNPLSGTTVIVSQAVAQGLGAVLGGQGTGPGATALLNALTDGGAIPSAQATALVQALAALGGSPTFANLVAAVRAYNEAASALTGPVPPALLAVRDALARML